MVWERYTSDTGKTGLLDKASRMPEGIPTWLLLVTFTVPAGGFLLGLSLRVGVSPENTRFVLSALVGAQASVLAIVFSVTVIGIQLVATRYSPRMISLFTNSPILIFTFLLFVVSIGLDIALLFNTPERNIPLFIGGLYSAIGFGLVSAVSLFAFIRSAIRQSTPEGVLAAFVDDLTPEKYLRQSRLAIEDDLKNVHPLQPLYAMIMEALSNRRRATADIALRNYGNLASSRLEAFNDRIVFETVEHRVANYLFKPVLEEHLQDIALHAEEQDESKLVGDATDWILTIGTAGFDRAESNVPRQAVMGLTNTIIHAPIDSGQYIANDSAWRALGDFLNQAAEHPDPDAVWSSASTIMSRGPQMLWRAHDGRRFRHSMTDLYGEMGMAHEHLLEHYGEELADVEMDWQDESVPDDTPNRERIRAIDRLRKAFFQTTGAFLGYLAEEEEYPITEGNFKDAWKKICIDASTLPARGYSIALCQAAIELCYVIGYVRPEDESWWMDVLARIKLEGDPETIDEAFKRILEYEPQEDGPGLLIGTDNEDRRARYYWNQISIEGFQPLNAHPGFPDRIESLQERVDERWTELEEW